MASPSSVCSRQTESRARRVGQCVVDIAGRSTKPGQQGLSLQRFGEQGDVSRGEMRPPDREASS